MEKNLLIQNLKTKAGIDNLSDRTYDEVATILLPQFADDEKITDESWNLPIQMLKSMSGQLRHEVAEGITKGKTQWETEQKTAQQAAIEAAVAKAKEEWEKAHPDPNDPDPDPNAGKNLDEKIAAAIAKAMEGVTGEEGTIGKVMKQFTDFMAKSEQDKKDAIVSKLREDLKTYLIDERLADREPVVNLAIKDMEITAESDLDKLKVEVEKKYEALYKDLYGDSGSGPYAGGAGGGSDSNKEFDKFIKERKAQAEAAAKETEDLEKNLM